MRVKRYVFTIQNQSAYISYVIIYFNVKCSKFYKNLAIPIFVYAEHKSEVIFSRPDLVFKRIYRIQDNSRTES